MLLPPKCKLASVHVSDEERTRRLRQCYLDLLLDAIHRPADSRLPGPTPTWREVTERW